MDKLEALNRADEARAAALLEPLIERAPEIARGVAGRRPFATAGELEQAIRAELFGLDEAARVRLFRAHPELAPENPLAMTRASQSEQGRLNLTADDNEFRARLDALNAAYRDKFGFPFITALVRHKNLDSVLAEFESRLAADRETEIGQALEQVAAVSAARVRATFAGADAVAGDSGPSPAARSDSAATDGERPQGAGARSVDEHSALGWGGEIGGALLLLLSIVFMVGGWELGLGVPTRLGTGAFPFFSGAILAVLAVVICIEERRGDGIAELPDWIGLLAICAALSVFAVTAERIGLVPAAFLTVVVASLPDRSLRFRGKAILGCIVALACWGLFIELLNLPFKPFVGI